MINVTSRCKAGETARFVTSADASTSRDGVKLVAESWVAALTRGYCGVLLSFGVFSLCKYNRIFTSTCPMYPCSQL